VELDRGEEMGENIMENQEKDEELSEKWKG
jgi:hypothetical protein